MNQNKITKTKTMQKFIQNLFNNQTTHIKMMALLAKVHFLLTCTCLYLLFILMTGFNKERSNQQITFFFFLM